MMLSPQLRLVLATALAVASISCPLAHAMPGDAPFCRTVVQSLLTCPSVPTVDTVELSSYTGRWYEIGVNAQFAFAYFGQKGAQCVQANYTALGVVNGLNTIKVENRALSVSSTLRQSQALVISQGAFASGVGVRFLCQFLVGEESLGSLFPLLETAEKFLPNLAKIITMNSFKAAMKGMGAAKAQAVTKIIEMASLHNLKQLTDAQVNTIVDVLMKALEKLPLQYQQQAAIVKDVLADAADPPAAAPAPASAAGPAAAAIDEKLRTVAAATAATAMGATSTPVTIPTALNAPLERVVQTALDGYTKTEWEGIIKSSIKMLATFASIPNGTLDTPLSVVGLSSVIIVAGTLSSNLTSEEKAFIKAEVANILTAVDAASAAAAEVFTALEQVQGSNNVITGATLPTPYVLPKVKGDFQLQVSKIQALEAVLNQANRDIITGAHAIKAVAAGKDPVVTKAAIGITSLAWSHGPLSLSVKDIGAGATTIGTTAGTLSPEVPQPSINDIQGTAVQSPTNAGALTVNFFNSTGGPPNYKIIKLEGDAATGYDLAIVFSCSPDFTTAYLPQNGFFILSRTPTVPQAVIDSSLAFAAQQGIVLAGDNPFLTVSQDADLCKPLSG